MEAHNAHNSRLTRWMKIDRRTEAIAQRLKTIFNCSVININQLGKSVEQVEHDVNECTNRLSAVSANMMFLIEVGQFSKE